MVQKLTEKGNKYMETALIIMAAGIGSRFGGGIKQLAPVGPSGEIIMDYSIHDALEAGFDKVVFIIRHDLEKDFREIIGNRIEKICPCSYAYQEVTNLPEGFKNPEGRTKPWGTGQALLSCKGIVDVPSLVINADDYYGKDAYVKLHDYIVNRMDVDNKKVLDIAMPGFILGNTLSDNGAVTRGVCRVDSDGFLTDISETSNIFKGENGGAYVENKDGSRTEIDPRSYVSMNMWAFAPEFINRLESGFVDFLKDGNQYEMKAEYLLPTVIGDMLKQGSAKVKVLPTSDKWFGVTYKEDKDYVIESFRRLIDAGVYKAKLFD